MYTFHGFGNVLLAALQLLLISLPLGNAELGINYGRLANNLPSPSTAVSLIKSLGFSSVKIFDADSQVLKAMSNSGLSVTIMVKNQEISTVASNSTYASSWVHENVSPYISSTKITTVLVGNEVFSDTNLNWSLLVPAMQNIHAALKARNLTSRIKVGTPLASDSLVASYPPSAGQFRSDLPMQSLLAFLSSTGAPYHANVYPYFAYSGGANGISLDYALFGSSSTVVTDGSLGYKNLFDAMTDATIAAMERQGYGNVPIVISETGWPSAGDSSGGATTSNAQLYNSRLARKVKNVEGTPRRPGIDIPTYIFALFNENEKTGADTERNFGLLYPDGSPVYQLS